MDQSQYPISALIAFTITILMFYLPFSSFIPWQRSLINLCVNTIKIILKVWYLTTQTCNNFLLWLQICEIFLAENFQLRQQSNSFSFNFFFSVCFYYFWLWIFQVMMQNISTCLSVKTFFKNMTVVTVTATKCLHALLPLNV